MPLQGRWSAGRVDYLYSRKSGSTPEEGLAMMLL
jgi:hypothetical protein